MKREDIARLIWERGEPQMPRDLTEAADKGVSAVNVQLWRASAPQTDEPLFQQVYNGAYIPICHPDTGEPVVVLLVTEDERKDILKRRSSPKGA